MICDCAAAALSAHRAANDAAETYNSSSASFVGATTGGTEWNFLADCVYFSGDHIAARKLFLAGFLLFLACFYVDRFVVVPSLYFEL